MVTSPSCYMLPLNVFLCLYSAELTMLVSLILSSLSSCFVDNRARHPRRAGDRLADRQQTALVPQGPCCLAQVSRAVITPSAAASRYPPFKCRKRDLRAIERASGFLRIGAKARCSCAPAPPAARTSRPAALTARLIVKSVPGSACPSQR